MVKGIKDQNEEKDRDKIRIIKVGDVLIGGRQPLVLIAGPCVLEDERVVFQTTEAIKKIAGRLGMGFIFKSSYKKDNRSSAKSYQGPGLTKGLKMLARVKRTFDVPISPTSTTRRRWGPRPRCWT